jgi:hypothetical protein
MIGRLQVIYGKQFLFSLMHLQSLANGLSLLVATFIEGQMPTNEIDPVP